MAEKTMVDPGTHLYPTPAVMVSSADAGGRESIIAIAWVGILSSVPPKVGIGVTPARYSHGIISESGEFVINLPTADMVRELDYTGSFSGRDVDKFAELGLTRVPPTNLSHAPLIDECPVNLECRVEQRIGLGSHDAFIAEIVAVHARGDWVDDSGRPTAGAGDLLAYAGGLYRSLGEVIGSHGFSRGR